jgi:hypothetical protein
MEKLATLQTTAANLGKAFSAADVKAGLIDAIGYLLHRISMDNAGTVSGHVRADVYSYLAKQYALSRSGFASGWGHNATGESSPSARGPMVVFETLHDQALLMVNRGEQDLSTVMNALLYSLSQFAETDDNPAKLAGQIQIAARRYRNDAAPPPTISEGRTLH